MTHALTAIALAFVVLPVSNVARSFEGHGRGAERPALHGVTSSQHVTAPQPHQLLDNATTTVTRLRFRKGAGERVHSHPFPLLVVQLTAGEVDLTVSDARGRGRREAGLVTFVPAGTPHAVVNAGATSFDMIAVALKPARPAAPAAPPTEAPAGITRTTLIDNSDVRVVRVQFAPGSLEPVHTHPNDLLTVQLTAGTLDILMDSARTAGRRGVGFTRFLPRDVPHAFTSKSRYNLEIVFISIK